ncbi:MAG: hypothetical protein ABFS03_13275, partial [Chloroflexota bacterium]
MTKQEAPKDVIESYRKSQERSRRAPLIFALAAFLLIAGAAVLIFWLTGADTTNISLSSIFATDTPTPTATATATQVPPTGTPTQTPTPLPPTDTPEPTIEPTRSGPVIYIVEEG